MTLEEFLVLPEEKPALELEPDGTVVQKMSPKGRHSRLQFSFLKLFNDFAEPRRLAIAFSELRDIFGGAAYVPDVSVYLWDRIPRDPNGEVQDNFTEPPDIAIEIVSPGQSVNSLVRRSVWYVDNGVRIACVVDPEDRSVLMFRPGQAPTSARNTEAIDLTDVLTGLNITAADVFSVLKIG